jgi:hypothetical protein
MRSSSGMSDSCSAQFNVVVDKDITYIALREKKALVRLACFFFKIADNLQIRLTPFYV